MAMTDTEFHQLADDMFQAIENAIETAIDEQDADLERQLILGSGGRWRICDPVRDVKACR